MDWIIKPPSKLRGLVIVPADKSITHRAIMLAALSEGESRIDNYLPADDCLSTLAAFRKMGVAIEKTPATLTVRGAGLKSLSSPQDDIDAGNSGTTVRLLSGILAGQRLTARIIGDPSLSKRPMKRIIDPLRQMGVTITARDDNFLPMTLQGSPDLKPISYQSPIPSAQVKSCVLLAGIQARGETIFSEPLRSRDHTERMLKSRGVDITVRSTSVAVRGPALLRPRDLTVPGDISSAAFFLVAGILFPDAEITLSNIGINPTRDGILEVLEAMGAPLSKTKVSEVSGEPVADVSVKNSVLKAAEITAGIIPRLIDEIPVIVLAATQAHGTTVISGAGELRVKESDRLATIASELAKMGAKITEKDDGLVIQGPTPLRGAVVQSHGDHRIAMTLAIAGLLARGETKIENVDCVDTSFPGFLSQVERLTHVP